MGFLLLMFSFLQGRGTLSIQTLACGLAFGRLGLGTCHLGSVLPNEKNATHVIHYD